MRVAILGLDVAPMHKQLVLRDKTALARRDEAMALPLVIALHGSCVSSILVDHHISRDALGLRPPLPALTETLSTHHHLEEGLLNMDRGRPHHRDLAWAGDGFR